MKKCAYCGHENEDAADWCVECGTKEFNCPQALNTSCTCSCPEPSASHSAPRKSGLRMAVLPWLTITALYGPCIVASLLTSDRWPDKLARVKFWPMLPGVGLLLMLSRTRLTMLDSAFATSALGIVVFAWMVRFRQRPAVAVVPVAIMSLLIGVFVYGGFAM